MKALIENSTNMMHGFVDVQDGAPEWYVAVPISYSVPLAPDNGNLPMNYQARYKRFKFDRMMPVYVEVAEE